MVSKAAKATRAETAAGDVLNFWSKFAVVKVGDTVGDSLADERAPFGVMSDL